MRNPIYLSNSKLSLEHSAPIVYTVAKEGDRMAVPAFSEITVSQICAVGRVNFTNIGYGTKQLRPLNAIYLKLSGLTTYESQGATYISDASHIVFLPKNSSYTVHFCKPGECFLLEFDSEGRDYDILSAKISNPSAFINHMLRIENQWLFKKPGYMPRCMSVLYEILALLDELTNASYLPSSKANRISGAIAHLEENYTDPELSIGEIAQASGISEVYFRRLFDEIYHTPPSQYLRNIRIEKAKGLLIGDYTSIEDIAHAVGFASIYHFCKTFRQLTGQTPTAFAATAHE